MRLFTRNRCFICALWATLLIALPLPAQDDAFDQLARKYLDEFTALHPVSATLLGDHRFDSELDDISAASREKELQFCRDYLRDLEALDRAKLSRDRQVDAALLAHHLRSTMWHIERLREWSWNPLVYTGMAGDAVYGLMAREFAPEVDRLRSVTSRLEKFPRLLEQVRQTLDVQRVPPIHAETAVKQNRGILTVLEQLVEPRLEVLESQERTRLTNAITTARGAVQQHQQWLEQQLVPQAAGEFRLGEELYDMKLAFTLQSPLSRQEIRQRAEAEIARVRDEMWQIARQVYLQKHPYTQFPADPSPALRQAIIRAALEQAYADLPPADKIVDVARQSLELCTEFVKQHDLLTLPPDPVEIIIMPEFRRGVSLAYCDPPGPLDVGQKTYYAVAPIPQEWTASQVQSFLREYNTRSLHDLTIHEAMPGHFVQLAISNRYPSTLRAVLASGVFIEGWGVYAEQVMSEEGFLDKDPLMRLIALKWYLRGVANAIIDQAIHVDGMTREDALELMIEQTFQEEREAAAKWIRAQLTSAQLATYFVGYQEHRDLRAEVERTWGKDFSLKRYHDSVLSFGSPPVSYVRALLLDLEIP